MQYELQMMLLNVKTTQGEDVFLLSLTSRDEASK